MSNGSNADSGLARIEATVLAVIPEYHLAKIETDDGHQYGITERTSGLSWNQVREGQRVACTVTTSLPRVVEVLQVLSLR